MNKFFKITSFISILFIIFNLVGCSSTDSAEKDSKKETKTVEVTAKAENNTEQVTNQQTSVEQAKTTAASPETKEEQPAEVKTESEQSSQPAQQNPAESKPTANTSSTASKNTATTTTKTTGTTTTKSTGTTTTKTTGTTTQKTTGTTTSKTTSTAPSTTTNSTPAPKPAVTAPKPVATVTISITGPKDRGTILSASKVKIEDGYTIFDVVKQAAKAKGIVVDSTGSGATAYIEGIDNIYEFDYGAKSGWVFKHNGLSITKSIGVIKVKDGDQIACYYTE
ncbi:hypothetical protein COJ85_22295 [Bacillus sp. AFS076308]|uniref:DUF4430 domain-containing protein n=1 Tax=unclassified Bacillus (in: firmicutes) TaxID=185979 RepID=UPI000BF764DB|nr:MULTISPECIES: DUF4430 domain-containing protein [unclassified Bacillus (in: firmicutes)]PFN97771.1 hypothetical protein COJ85_22295 [Bacillus sp. AFS076308]PGV51107.1 hypothetical protein COD92_15100 [Bacillus sp. AFS037270]